MPNPLETLEDLVTLLPPGSSHWKAAFDTGTLSQKYANYPPPLLDFKIHSDLQWADVDILAKPIPLGHIRKAGTLPRAVTVKVPPTDYESALAEFDENTLQNLRQSEFEDLIMHNPGLASGVLLKFSQTKKRFKDALQYLLQMTMSAELIEVINRIATEDDREILPTTFIYSFISKIIQACEVLQGSQQKRFARLISLFISNLMKQELVKMEDIFIEIQAFCISHSKLKETQALFRTLKSWDTQNQGDFPGL